MAASTVYDFNRGWLFGGEYVAKSEQPGFEPPPGYPRLDLGGVIASPGLQI